MPQRCPGERPGLEVRSSARGDRGVFATVAIPRGTLIEESPLLVLSGEEWRGADETVLHHYAFGWGPRNKGAVIGLGFTSLYNHSYNPNARAENKEKRLVMRLFARRDIARGEEITINYNGTPRNLMPVWFRVTDPDET